MRGSARYLDVMALDDQLGAMLAFSLTVRDIQQAEVDALNAVARHVGALITHELRGMAVVHRVAIS